MAGRASYMMATRNTASAEKAFGALVARYPETPNVHYANAVFLLQEQPDKAIDEFKRELELQPEHAWSLMQIAYEYVNRGDSQTGAAVGQTRRRRSAQCLRGAQGAGAGAARHWRHRRRDKRTRARHQDGAGEPRPALHAGTRLSACRPHRGCGSRARGVHTARSTRAHAEERRAVCGGKMTALRLPVCVAVLMVMVIPGGSAHQEQAPPRAGTVVQGVRAILVDVVVRDRKGQPVRDLTAADFEVLEDGVTQKVGSFTPFLDNATATAADSRRRARRGNRPSSQCSCRGKQRTYRHGARFRSIVAGSAAPRGAGRAGLSRKQGRDCQLYRNLRASTWRSRPMRRLRGTHKYCGRR